MNKPVNDRNIEEELMIKLQQWHPNDKQPDQRIFEELLAKTRHDPSDLPLLLGPLSDQQLEALAQKASRITTANFGKTVALFTPLYLANYCENHCIYCAFNGAYHAKREKLTESEIIKECQTIKEQGLDEILLLTGESRKHSDTPYLLEACKTAAAYLTSVGIEVYPLETDEYKQLCAVGVSALTIYQETYDPVVYDRLHLKGPKKNFSYRLNTPERGAAGGMNKINIGALLGLTDPWLDGYMTIWHLWLLLSKYPSVEWGLSLPRIKAIENGTFNCYPVDDRTYVQILLSYRLMFPTSPISVSTRESNRLRKHLLPLGVTKISAGVSTSVGRTTKEADATAQFLISDDSGIPQIKSMIKDAGYQPITKNWLSNHCSI